jgi:hypothetical protein
VIWLSTYDQLLEEARGKARALILTAKEYIPKMYVALRNEDSNISPDDARDRIEKDCGGIWSKRTILDALPDEAKDRKKQKASRLRQGGKIMLQSLQHPKSRKEKKFSLI